MSAPDWKRIKDVFHEALRFEAGEQRKTFLDRECGVDMETRVEVESLLLSLSNASDFLELPVMVPTDASGLQLPSGHEIGHYTITEHIATGGMGEIYLAEDQKLRRKVALKVLNEVMPASAEQLRRFQREAMLVSSLNHPNILTIYDIDVVSDIHLFASEFVDGVTVRSRLAHGQIPVDEAIDITIQTLSALQAAHQAGIVHRDIKPENIMIRDDGLVKVLDFGLAKFAKPQYVDGKATTWEQIFSRPGMIMGTAAYMSPEQARGKRLDGRSDIFSSGVVFYEMLVGSAPFRGQTATDIIAALIQDDVPQVSHRNHEVPSEIDAVVARMVEKDKDARYDTAAQVVSALRIIRFGYDRTLSGEQGEAIRREPVTTEIEPHVPVAGVPVTYYLLVVAVVIIAALIAYSALK